MTPKFTISADEINLLVLSYLQDSGFTHSAFAFKSEALLERSSLFNQPIERGQLIELLIKALNYTEVESHLRGSVVNESCKAPFSLIKRHECSVDQAEPSSIAQALSRPPQPNASASARGSAVVESVLGNQKQSTSRNSTQDDPYAMEIDQPSSSFPPLPKNTKNPIALPVPPIAKSRNVITIPQFIGNKGAEIDFPTVHSAEVFVVAWNPKIRNMFATGTKDATIRIWKVPDQGKPAEAPITVILPKKGELGDLTAITFNSAGNLLAVGCYDTVLRIYDRTGQFLWEGTAHKGPIFSVKWHPTKNTLITASLDGSACLWSHDNKGMVRQWKAHVSKPGASCLDVEWLDDDTFASCGTDMQVHIIKTSRTSILRTLEGGVNGHSAEVSLVRLSPGGGSLATSCDDGTARVWKLNRPFTSQGGDIPLVLRGHNSSVSGLRWQPNPKWGVNPIIATGSFDGNLRIWDSVTGKTLKRWNDHGKPVYAITFSPDSRFITSGGGDGKLNIYDMRTYNLLFSWQSEIKKGGIFEAEWQVDAEGKPRWIALALENRKCVVLDVQKIASLR